MWILKIEYTEVFKNPVGMELMSLLPKSKKSSAGLLSKNPGGIKVMALSLKNKRVINVSPLNAATGMKEISLLFKKMKVVVAIHTEFGTWL